MSNEIEHELDARHILCPMPVIKVQKLIASLDGKAVGEKVRVTCTDPGTLYDIPAWAKIHGHTLIEKKEVEHEYIIVIEIGDA